MALAQSYCSDPLFELISLHPYPARSSPIISVFFATSSTISADNLPPFGLETKNLDPQYYGTSP
ncbi:MAG: hypothetical protein EA001_09355 [Oscillatoriales cyanobacterium]|nr:MAG: hypothetical protein EA001_09355 [Oscillatoriales cyanobacterium]